MAEAPLQAVWVETVGFVRRRHWSWWQDFDAELRKGARDVGGQPWPFGSGRRAEQLHGRDKRPVAAIGRRLRLVGPVQQETRGDDQMKRCDRNDDERCDLAANAAQIEKAHHDQWPAAVTASPPMGSTRGVNM